MNETHTEAREPNPKRYSKTIESRNYRSQIELVLFNSAEHTHSRRTAITHFSQFIMIYFIFLFFPPRSFDIYKRGTVCLFVFFCVYLLYFVFSLSSAPQSPFSLPQLAFVINNAQRTTNFNNLFNNILNTNFGFTFYSVDVTDGPNISCNLKFPRAILFHFHLRSTIVV